MASLLSYLPQKSRSPKVNQGPDCFPKAQRTYNQDGLITMHNCSFMEDPRFADAYRMAKQTGSWSGPWGQASIHWRAHTLCWAAKSVEHLDGHFVECGVDRGGTAMLILRYLELDKESNRHMFLYDTFCGLDPNRSSKKEMSNCEGIYSECYEEVKKQFADFSNVHIYRGSVPDTFDDTAPRQVAYLHLDLNSAAPETAAITFFWPRLVAGAIVIFDDYAWVACHQQKEAADQFARSVGVPILSLPTGQGLMIKPSN